MKIPSPDRAARLAYALVTPARNEEATLESTIRSVVSQTVLPERWVIVSDGSTDRTDDIAGDYSRRHAWIRLVRLPEHRDRQFAAKVSAFNAGLNALRDVRYDIVGNLDADITFGPDYFGFLLARFEADPSLGVCGTPFVEDGAHYDFRFSSLDHVSGACQLFRSACFQEIGGYVPIKGGGVDWTAVTTARMKGWRTRTFTERVCHHHRKMGSGNATRLGLWLKRGREDYSVGGHPVWQVFRALYQMTRRPYVVGGLLLLAGYGWAWFTSAGRPVSKELMDFHRREQMNRLKGFLAPRARRSDDSVERIESSLAGVEAWVEQHAYKGYEPFDGLSSYLRPLTFGSLFLDRVLMQAVRQSPVNLRPLLGIRPLESTIGRGYMAAGYLAMLAATGDGGYERKARACLDWLMTNGSPGHRELCWGKHFDFASRGGRYPRFEPIVVWTSLIAMAFLDAWETLGERKYLGAAESACRWISGLARHESDDGTYLSYTGSGQPLSVHNHSMLAAAVLARTAKHAPNPEYLRLARSIMTYSCSRQLPSGAWYYGEEPIFHWIDNFHTGYNLDALQGYIESTGDRELAQNLRRGFEFYVTHFFEENGRPRYYHDRTYPVDIQCISQSIETLTRLGKDEPRATELSRRVALWAVENMQDRRGFFYYRQYPLLKARTPMLHWGQATMYRGLALLLATLRAGERRAERPAGSRLQMAPAVR